MSAQRPAQARLPSPLDALDIDRAVADNAPVGVAVLRLEVPDDASSFRFLYANPKAAEIGADPEVYLGKTIAESFPSLLSTPIPAAYLSAVQTGQTQQLPEIRWGDENVLETVWSVSVTPISPAHVVVYYEDATARLKAEGLFRDLYDQSSAMLFTVSGATGGITLCNRTLLEALEQDADQLIGHDVATLFHPESQEDLHRVFARSAGGEPVRNVRLTLQRRGGEALPVLGDLKQIAGPDGSTQETRVSLRDLAHNRLTAEMAEEQRLLERRNADLKNFASLASHDLRAPLRAIRAFSKRLQEEHAENLSTMGNRYLHRISTAAERMQALVSALSEYAGLEKPVAHGPIELNRLIDDAVQNLALELVDRNAEICVAGPPSVVLGHRGQLTIAFQNLFSNGLKFNRSTAPHIFVDLIHESPHHVFVEVRDNGIGIDAQHLGRIMRMFERLHNDDEFAGTGMGLPTVKRVVELHGGALTVSSEPGKGTCFRFRLATAG